MYYQGTGGGTHSIVLTGSRIPSLLWNSVVIKLALFPFNYSMRALVNLEELEIPVMEELESLPDWIGELTNLKILNASACQLTSLPDRYVIVVI